MSLSSAPEKRYIGGPGTWLLGGFMLALGLLLIAAMIYSWSLAPQNGQKILWLFSVTPDLRLFLIVLLAGALGSWLHATSSFLAYVGNRNFVSSWIIWYVARPLIGSVLALIVYFSLRGGLMPNASAGDGSVSDFGFAAFSGLVGMFSERATKKLADVFEVIFPSKQEESDPLGEETAKAEPKGDGSEDAAAAAAGDASAATAADATAADAAADQDAAKPASGQ